MNAILNAVSQRVADHKGVFEEGCSAGPIPNAQTLMASFGGYDIYKCIVPTYISAVPTDPKVGVFNSPEDYATGYTIMKDSLTGRIEVRAPNAETASTTISVSR